ncbi:MAG TPA: rhamnogalacturonan lyase [Opitutaceae bacterium]|nr:rhamnogalacturonan lyase [Opitutaceae bacterium]
MKTLLHFVVWFGLLASLAHAQHQMENLGRGVVAIHQSDGKVFVSWRLLGTDPDNVAFNLYRKSDPLPGRGGFGGGRGAAGAPGVPPAANSGADSGRAGRGGGRGAGAAAGEPVKLNQEPLTAGTWFLDETANLGARTSYFVRAVVNGREQEPSTAFTLPAGAPPLPYLRLPLQTPEGAMPNDASAADLDGDGEYELVVKFEQRPRDNSQGGPTGHTFLQAYKLDGTLLWTIDLGKNIREGAHYTQFQVYDLDGDGRAEVVCKTADGTIDGKGKVIGDPNANWVQPEGATARIMAAGRGQTAKTERTENLAGHILSGPEYLTVFDGLTGAALATTNYLPARVEGTTALDAQKLNDVWGDARGNRSDRYLACVAYLDGVHPSVVMCRGYYTRTTLAAWDWRDGKLALRWFFDSDKFGPPDRTNPYRGQGNHNISVADVDGDGKDEIVFGAMVIDDDGKPLYSTGWGHGDTIHVGDFVTDNPGLEVFDIQERFDKQGMSMRDAKTGKPIFTIPSVQAATSGGDAGEGPGRGVAFNIDPRYPGAESWARGAQEERVGMLDAHGQKISDRTPRSCNFAVYWDGDFLQELLDQNYIAKWNWETGTETRLLTAQDCSSNNGTKATPALCADLFGDWREEVVWRTLDGKELRIYTTTIPTAHRLTTLMHDSQYRVAVAWQNTAYNQPPHPSFYLDEGAPLPARPRIAVVAKK